MGLFTPKKKVIEVMFIQEDEIRIGKDKWHKHSHEIQEIRNALSLLIKQNKKIMSKIDDLNQTVTDLQATVDAKQQQIADAIAAFEKTIADLTAQIGTGTGVTDEQLQTVIDNLTAAKADLEATPTA
jgi:peptidoglycan hydrolase CwlO-like protein